MLTIIELHFHKRAYFISKTTDLYKLGERVLICRSSCYLILQVATSINMSEPLGLLVAGKNQPLPLRSIAVEAEVKGYVLGLKSTLKYANDSADPVEVFFRFPLEQSHAVVGLTAVIDGRKIRAQIKEKEEARAAYDDAIASGQSAALGEEKSGDVFSISLGNLPPHKEAEIQLQLVGELPIEADGSVRFSLPTTLKPRYIPAGSSDPLAPVPSGEGGQVKHARISGTHHFQLKVLNEEEIAAVTSPTHVLQSITREKGELIISLPDMKSISGDLVMFIKQKSPHIPRALVEEAIEGSKKNGNFMSSPAVMINFFPEFANVEAVCEFVFLVDRSGSMSGSFIRSARETLILFLKSLPEGSFFNIIGFGSSYEKLFAKSVTYSQDTLDKATSHAQKMEADLGGTELLPPLEYVFSQKTLAGLPRQLFVLTDGSVSNTYACIQKVKTNVHTSRCFTFGIGSGASTALVEGLARAGNGTAEFVMEEERLQPKVIRSLKRALQPAITDVSVEFKVPSDFLVLQSPENLPSVFNGEKMVVYAALKRKAAPKRSEISATAILRGSLLGKALEYSVPFTFQSSTSAALALPAIHHLAAKALIKDWQDMGKSESSITKLSIESSVISSHTAFIAVDEESSKPVTGAMKTWDIQTEDFLELQAEGGVYGMPQISYNLAPASYFSSASKSKKKSGGLLSSLGSTFSGLFKRRVATDGDDGGGGRQSYEAITESWSFSPQLAQYGHVENAMSKPMEAFMEEDEEEDESEEDDTLNGYPRLSSRVPPPPTQVAPSPMDLSSIITAQQADGSWKLDATLAQLLAKSRKALQDGCPVACEGIMAAVWATVLVLSLLRAKYSSQQEEWELIAMKAESWVKRQTLPSGTAVEDLYNAAEKFLT